MHQEISFRSDQINGTGFAGNGLIFQNLFKDVHVTAGSENADQIFALVDGNAADEYALLRKIAVKQMGNSIFSVHGGVEGIYNRLRESMIVIIHFNTLSACGQDSGSVGNSEHDTDKIILVDSQGESFRGRGKICHASGRHKSGQSLESLMRIFQLMEDLISVSFCFLRHFLADHCLSGPPGGDEKQKR